MSAQAPTEQAPTQQAPSGQVPSGQVPSGQAHGSTPGPFDPPPGLSWTPISPKYASVKRISVSISYLLLAVATGLLGLLWSWLALGALIWIGIGIWRFTVMGRLVANWRYCLGPTDIYVTSGLMFRELQVVPYGRLQLVEVEAGPILRAHGLAEVTMTTASSRATPNIPGIEAALAPRLRDELTRRGQDQAAGL